MAGLGQKCERKPRRQAKRLLLITSSAIETKFEICLQFATGGNIGKVCCPFKNARWGFGFGNSAQFVIPEPHPLLLPRTSRRNGERGWHPLPAFGHAVFLSGYDIHRKRGQPAPRVPQHDSA